MKVPKFVIVWGEFEKNYEFPNLTAKKGETTFVSPFFYLWFLMYSIPATSKNLDNDNMFCFLI